MKYRYMGDHLDEQYKRKWEFEFPLRRNSIWMLRVSEECLLELPVSYHKTPPIHRVANPIPESYKETFSRTLEKNRKFANTMIWC
jgi:hypothetical protein